MSVTAVVLLSMGASFFALAVYLTVPPPLVTQRWLGILRGCALVASLPACLVIFIVFAPFRMVLDRQGSPRT